MTIKKQIERKMTNQDFQNALNSGNNEVIFTDIDGKEYTHVILKAGNIQVNLFNTFLNREYKLKFSNCQNWNNYRIK